METVSDLHTGINKHLMDQIMSKTQFRPKVEIEPYNSKLTICHFKIAIVFEIWLKGYSTFLGGK